MSKGYKILISVLATVLSLLAAVLGFGFVSGSDLLFPQKFLCNFAFLMQLIATEWCVTALFRKTRE